MYQTIENSTFCVLFFLFVGKLDSLKHHKDEVDTISSGKECGILVSDEDFIFEQGDVIECFDWKVVKKTVDWAPD